MTARLYVMMLPDAWMMAGEYSTASNAKRAGAGWWVGGLRPRMLIDDGERRLEAWSDGKRLFWGDTKHGATVAIDE